MVGDARFVVKERMSKPQVISSPSQLVAINALAGDRPVCWRDADFPLLLARCSAGLLRDHRLLGTDPQVTISARKHGCSVLTRNVRDFDFLQQLDPFGEVLQISACA